MSCFSHQVTCHFEGNVTFADAANMLDYSSSDPEVMSNLFDGLVLQSDMDMYSDGDNDQDGNLLSGDIRLKAESKASELIRLVMRSRISLLFVGNT